MGPSRYERAGAEGYTSKRSIWSKTRPGSYLQMFREAFGRTSAAGAPLLSRLPRREWVAEPAEMRGSCHDGRSEVG